jgi:hypothetical protein
MKYISTIFFSSLFLLACSKLQVPSVYFDVTTARSTYKKGDTITFNFTGNPDFISFYSDEPGIDYDFKNRNLLDGKTQVQFTSYKQNGAQLNSLQLLASTDFKNNYSKIGIQVGTWTDITARAILSTGADSTASGIIDITDFVNPYKQVYLAFRKMDASSLTLKPNQWTIRSFNVNVKLADSSLYPIATLGNAGWQAVDSLNSTFKWSISSSSLVCGGGTISSPANEDWVITKALSPLNVKPDVAIPIKWLDTKRTESYTYIYTTPGTYKLVFLASNQNITDKRVITKEIILVITN